VTEVNFLPILSTADLKYSPRALNPTLLNKPVNTMKSQGRRFWQHQRVSSQGIRGRRELSQQHPSTSTQSQDLVFELG